MQKSKIKYIDAPPILTLVISVLTLALMFINLGFIKIRALEYLFIILLYGLIFVLPSFVYLKKRGLGIIRRITFRFEKGKYLLLTLLVSLIVIFQSSIIKFGVFRIGYDYSAISLYGSSIPVDNLNFLEAIIIVFSVVLIPAVCEEFVFRGIIINEYFELGPYMAILGSSLLFAFVHLDYVLFPVYLINGLIIGLLAFVTKSIVYPMIAHAIYNLFVLFFEKYMWLLSSDNEGEVFFWVFAVLIYLFLVTIATIYFERLFKNKEYDRRVNGPETTQYAIKPVTYGNPFARMFLAVPMIGQMGLFIVVATIMILI